MNEQIIPEDIALQRQAMQTNESSILLKFNALSPVDCDKVVFYLPYSKIVSIYLAFSESIRVNC
jgi:hypothetical protein